MIWSSYLMVMIFDDGVTARRQEARRQDPAIMLVRAALLRRSCDGVAAATQLRRPGSVALILRVASVTELMLLRRS